MAKNKNLKTGLVYRLGYVIFVNLLSLAFSQKLTGESETVLRKPLPECPVIKMLSGNLVL